MLWVERKTDNLSKCTTLIQWWFFCIAAPCKELHISKGNLIECRCWVCLILLLCAYRYLIILKPSIQSTDIHKRIKWQWDYRLQSFIYVPSLSSSFFFFSSVASFLVSWYICSCVVYLFPIPRIDSHLVSQ